MTLVVSLLTRDRIVQASDRRLVDPVSGSPVAHGANKAVVFCGHFTVGYTGLSQIAGKPTDIWICEILANAQNSPNPFKIVQDQASAAFARIRHQPDKRHAFLFSGWAHKSKEDPELECIAIRVSNFRSGRRREAASDQFELQYVRLEKNQAAALVPVGSIPTKAETEHFWKNFEARRAGSELEHGGGVLTSLIRRVSRRDASVGSEITVCSIPRGAVERGSLHLSMRLDGAMGAPDEISAYYTHLDGEERVQFAPSYVCGGMAMAGVVAK